LIKRQQKKQIAAKPKQKNKKQSHQKQYKQKNTPRANQNHETLQNTTTTHIRMEEHTQFRL
jgi:hypothetical protein